MNTFPHVFQPTFDEIFHHNYHLRGEWAQSFFGNDHPIVVEVGCGKGEYTVGLAARYPEKNFIGIDIKGARMWVGAADALQRKMPNVAFLRTRVEFIAHCFAPEEISEIWITFPDPQPQKTRINKRLTSAQFLNNYQLCLKRTGCIHLKTDSTLLYHYTSKIVAYNHLEVFEQTSDLYHSGKDDDILSIRTHYETLFMARGETIKYLRFALSTDPIQELPEEEAVFATDSDRSKPTEPKL